jgi:hypothetical protein
MFPLSFAASCWSFNLYRLGLFSKILKLIQVDEKRCNALLIATGTETSHNITPNDGSVPYGYLVQTAQALGIYVGDVLVDSEPAT